MGLYQKDIDGVYYYYDEIVAFDQSLNDGKPAELLIRRDIFDKFLEENEYKAFWSVKGEKTFFLDNRAAKWSNWSGCFLYNNNKIEGSFKCIDKS